jgi:hypothetical protein
MAKQYKTQKNDESVLDFLNSVESEQRRKDGLRMLEIMNEVTGMQPKMWGSSIIGYGEYKAKTGNWMMTGFSPRKTSLTVYAMGGINSHSMLLDKLGPYKTGSSCLYIKKLSDIDEGILREIIKADLQYMRDTYETIEE